MIQFDYLFNSVAEPPTNLLDGSFSMINPRKNNGGSETHL